MDKVVIRITIPLLVGLGVALAWVFGVSHYYDYKGYAQVPLSEALALQAAETQHGSVLITPDPNVDLSDKVWIAYNFHSSSSVVGSLGAGTKHTVDRDAISGTVLAPLVGILLLIVAEAVTD